MPKRPIDEDVCLEGRKSERTENEERLAKELERMNELLTDRRSTNDEKKKKRTFPLQQNCLEVKIFERRIIESENSGATFELEEEMANVKKEKEVRRSGGEDNVNLNEELSTLRDEVKRLQRHVTTLKYQKRKAEAKNDELVTNKDPTGDAALHAKEKTKMKKKIKELMIENKQLTREKEKRDGRREEKHGYSNEEYNSLKEENKKLMEELRESLEIREKLNATVNESESSNVILTKQLEWYKKGWLTFHEFAREEINKNEKEENHLGLDSISMPPEHGPLRPPPPFCGSSPSYDIPYYPSSPSPVYNTPVYETTFYPPPSPICSTPVYNGPPFRPSVYTPGYGTPFLPPPSPGYRTPHFPPPSPMYSGPFPTHPPPSPRYSTSFHRPPPPPSLIKTTPCPPPPPPPPRSTTYSNRGTVSRPFSIRLSNRPPPPPPPPASLHPPPHQIKIEVKTENIEDATNSN